MVMIPNLYSTIVYFGYFLITLYYKKNSAKLLYIFSKLLFPSGRSLEVELVLIPLDVNSIFIILNI